MKTIVGVDGKPVETLERLMSPAEVSAILAQSCMASPALQAAENISSTLAIPPQFVGEDWFIPLDPQVRLAPKELFRLIILLLQVDFQPTSAFDVSFNHAIIAKSTSLMVNS